jgi:hypothetical protein
MKRPQGKSRKEYEARDVAPRPVLYSAALLFAGIGLSAAAVAGLFGLLAPPPGQGAASLVERTPIVPPRPRLETDGKADRLPVEAAAAEKLQGYAWVDRAAGTVRIPIERAMQLLVARGWPDEAKEGGTP